MNENKQLNMIDNPWIYLFLVLFVAMLITIGLIAKKKSKNADDYAMARNSYPWYAIGLSILAAAASGMSFLGSGGMAYGMGFPCLWYFLGYPIVQYGCIALAGRFGKQLNSTKSRSISEFAGKRFNSKAIRTVMALASLCTILAAASQLTSISTLLEVIFDFRYTLGLIIGVALVLAYITIGGAHADIMANTVQGAIMVICSLICVWLFMDRVGEYGGLMEFGRRLYDYNPDLSPALLFTDPEVSIQYAGVTGVITMVLAHCTFMFMPHVGVKLAALNKQKDMPKVIILVAVIGMCCSVFPALPGFAGILDIPGVEKADMIVPLMFIKFLPKAIAAFLLVGIFAAIISTASGMFLSMAQSISNDIYRQHIAPKMGHSEEKTDKNAVRVAKVSLVCLCVIAVACVWVPPSYLTLFGWIGNGANMAVIAPTIIMSNVYKRTTTKGLLAAQICNLILFAIMYFGFGWTGMMCGGICVVVGCVLTFVFSKVTKNIITKDYLFENGFYTREELERIKI